MAALSVISRGIADLYVVLLAASVRGWKWAMKPWKVEWFYSFHGGERRTFETRGKLKLKSSLRVVVSQCCSTPVEKKVSVSAPCIFCDFFLYSQYVS